jgi:hypothetical protein
VPKEPGRPFDLISHFGIEGQVTAITPRPGFPTT